MPVLSPDVVFALICALTCASFRACCSVGAAIAVPSAPFTATSPAVVRRTSFTPGAWNVCEYVPMTMYGPASGS